MHVAKTAALYFVGAFSGISIWAIGVSFYAAFTGMDGTRQAYVIIGGSAVIVVWALIAGIREATRPAREEQEAAARQEKRRRQEEERRRPQAEERARADAAKQGEAEAKQREAEERRRQEAETRAQADEQVLQWKDVPHSAPLRVPGGPTPLLCDECAGTGVVTRKKVTTEITLVTPTETRPCGDCSGTGTGRKAQAGELKEYLAEPSPVLAQVFALAEEKAKLLCGLQGLITTPDGVLPLLAKDSWYRVEGNRVDRGAAAQEDTDTVTQYCLTKNGSFLVRSASHETWLDNSRWTQIDQGWGPWNIVAGHSIDDFMSEFDFTASGRRNQSDLRERSEKVSHCSYYGYKEADRYLDLRRIYGVKGEGLLAALMDINPS